MKLAQNPIHPVDLGTARTGLTMRQHYAGLAMQGVVATGAELSYKETAEIAVRLADALLEELEDRGAS